MDERLRQGEGTTQGLTPREERVCSVLGFYFDVPKQVVGRLAKQNGIDFNGRFTRKAFSELSQAVEGWKDKSRGDLGKNLNGGPEVSAGVDVESMPVVTDSSHDQGISEPETKVTPKKQRGGRRQPAVSFVPHTYGRLPADRNLGQDDDEPSAPEGLVNLKDASAVLGVSMTLAEIKENFGISPMKGPDGRNRFMKADLEKVRAQINTEKNGTAEGDRCKHHWLLGSPIDGVVHQICTGCGQETDVDTRATLSAYVVREQNTRPGF